MSMKKGPKPLRWRDEEDHNRPDDVGSPPAVTTPEGPFLDANQVDPIRGVFHKFIHFIL